MPGEGRLLREFVMQIAPRVLGQLIDVVFDRMKLAGEAGSLLKIEEETRDVVSKAKRQWTSGSLSTQRLLFDQEQSPVQQRFDLSGVTDSQFFEHAESKVIASLNDYANQAQAESRLQRRLFAEDTVHGFAFIGLCQKRFDVVLMNPPFGESTKASQEYLAHAFQDTKADLATQFCERFSELLVDGCILGVLSTRTWLFVKRYESWRRRLSSHYQIRCMADLGYGVLDAVVETAAVTWERSRHQRKAAFISALRDANKMDAIRDSSHVLSCDTDLF